MSKKISFFEWMEQTYAGTDTPAGDLIHDMQADPDFPRTSSKHAMFDYLVGCGACNAAIDVFEDCYRAYKSVV